jgi:hypothetical protein
VQREVLVEGTGNCSIFVIREIIQCLEAEIHINDI